MSTRVRSISPRYLGPFLTSPVLARALRHEGPRRSRSGVGLGEDLEKRIVLSDVGGNLLGSALNAIGVVTGPVLAPASSSSSAHTSQLQKDVQALQTELASLAAKSGVTVADLTGLAADSQALAQGGRIDVKSLDAAVDELATAIAGGTSTTQAQTDFAAVYAKTSVAQATIAQAFTDLSKTITDSGVTSTDLSTVAADQAAIKSDLSSRPGGSGQSGNTGTSSGGGSSGSGSGSSSTGSGSGSTGSGSGSSSSSSSGSGSSNPSSGGSTTVTTPITTPPLPTQSTSTTGDTAIASTTTPTATATGTSTSTDDSSSSTSGTTTTSTNHKATKGHKSGTHAGHVSVKVHAAKTQARSHHTG
jgi:hypothetical protein